MKDHGNAYLLEDDTDLTNNILLEDGSGILLLESAGQISFNNYEFVTVGDGMSTSEKIR